MNLFSRRMLGGLVAVAATALMVGSGMSQQINLKFNDSLPLNDRNTQMSILPWMERVTERTNGQVTFTHFPNGQIGKGQDALASRGRGASGRAGRQQADRQFTQFLVSAKEGETHPFLVVRPPRPGSLQVGGRSALCDPRKRLHGLGNTNVTHVD